MRPALLLTAVAGGLALAVAAPAAAADTVLLDRHDLPNGSVTLELDRKLEGTKRHRDAIFHLHAQREEQTEDGVIADSGMAVMSMERLPERGRRRLSIAVHRLACEDVVAIYGLAHREVRRIELVHQDGAVTALPRRRAPGAWRFRGSVAGRIFPGAAWLAEVRARNAGGKVVARVKPPAGEPCDPDAMHAPGA